LINATFDWIKENIRDEIDFVIWTGDSARHDNDERLPRSDSQVLDLNRLLVRKFDEVFGKDDNKDDDNPNNDHVIPIVPTYGNNDILPHNVMPPGPNKWTKAYLKVWKSFIPEAQKHTFERGGWFYVEVIPNKLAVFSLNTLYFFDNNVAVDGCAAKSEIGYEHFEWLRIQLRFLRQRGMKAIMMGHVPPAKTESKHSWDESCWQKYTLWMHQFRDVVVGSTYGHMNIDHFLLQDANDLSLDLVTEDVRAAMDDELTVQATEEYLTELRVAWSHLPQAPKAPKGEKSKKQKGNKDKQSKFEKKIGGPWAERYSMSLVSPSVVPNYFPTLRIVEYNITGLEGIGRAETGEEKEERLKEESGLMLESLLHRTIKNFVEENDIDELKKKHKKKKKKGKKHPDFKTPQGPSKSSPPGPAYSPQTLSWLSYEQLFANLTVINNDFMNEDDVESSKRWSEGKHGAKKPKNKPHPKKFHFELEYDTRNDSNWGLKDLTLRSYIDLAARMGKFKPGKGDGMDVEQSRENSHQQGSEGNAQKDKKHRHKGKRRTINRAWYSFVRRALVGTIDDEELHEHYGQPVEGVGASGNTEKGEELYEEL
jgi:endopolyphosphatase